jgi:hypothetical protein
MSKWRCSYEPVRLGRHHSPYWDDGVEGLAVAGAQASLRLSTQSRHNQSPAPPCTAQPYLLIRKRRLSLEQRRTLELFASILHGGCRGSYMSKEPTDDAEPVRGPKPIWHVQTR